MAVVEVRCLCAAYNGLQIDSIWHMLKKAVREIRVEEDETYEKLSNIILVGI